jgi:hypothetical protein
MGRETPLFIGLLSFAVLAAGCATNQLGNPFGSTSTGTSSTAAAAKKPAADDPAVAQKKPGMKKSSIIQTGATSKTARDDDDPSSDRNRADVGSSRGAKDDGFDPKTMAYINRELRDASPDERRELMADLKGLHPDAIRNILRGRRMAKNYDKQQAIVAERKTNPYPQGPIQVATGDGGDLPGGPRRGGSAADAGSGFPGAEIAGNTGRQPAGPVASAGVDGYQGGPGAAGGAVVPPVGHSTGYRVDSRTGNPIESGSTASAGPAVRPGRVNSAIAQSTGKQQNVTQALGNSGPQRGPGSKPQLVALGGPVGAGPGPMGSVTGTGIPNDGSPREQLARLISATESETFALQPGETEGEKQAYIEKHVHLRMLYLMSGQQERALQAIPGLDPADQEFWQQTFWGMTNYFDSASIPSSADRAAQTVTQMTNAVLRLQEKANLDLRNVTFCHRISSFGNYEKYPREEFSPGQEVLLYAEVANIHSEPIPDGKFRTSLKSTLEIYRHGPQGEMIERIDLPETVDICRTHRRDYFHSYQFTIPTKLSLGPHVLKLSVEDQISRRVATYTLNFMIK